MSNLRKKYNKETGQGWLNINEQISISYVKWLENKIELLNKTT